MGTCGLVGPIGVYTGWLQDISNGSRTGISAFDWAGLLFICLILPALLTPLINTLCIRFGWVKRGDMKL